MKANLVKLTGLTAIALGIFPVSSAWGFSFNEVGDAGELLSTAQTPHLIGSLTSISGTLADLDGLDDVDLFKIVIDDTDAFSVTVSANLSEDNDTQLFLFNSEGFLVLSNDDRGSKEVLPQFNPGDLSGEFSGTYYLAFSLFETIPVGSPLTGWNRDPQPFQTGSYTLTLTGVSAAPVPEPFTLLGTATALTFGVFFKSKLSQSNKKL